MDTFFKKEKRKEKRYYKTRSATRTLYKIINKTPQYPIIRGFAYPEDYSM